jgi:hypothetical protein
MRKILLLKCILIILLLLGFVFYARPGSPSGEPGEPLGVGVLGLIPLTGGAIPVTGAGLMSLLCGSATSFILENGNMVTYAPDLCGYQASMAMQGDEGLPAAMPAGSILVDGVVANLILEGSAVDDLPPYTHITLLFVNPSAGAVVLFWDATNNAWVEVPATHTPDGRLEVESTLSGLYVMVTQ